MDFVSAPFSIPMSPLRMVPALVAAVAFPTFAQVNTVENAVAVKSALGYQLKTATAPMKDGRATVAIDTSRLKAAQTLKVSDVAGKDVTSVVSTARAGKAETTLSLTPNVAYILSPRQTASTQEIKSPLKDGLKKRAYFAAHMVMAVPDAATGNADVFIGVPFVEFVSDPLPWDPLAGSYSSRLLVGIDPTHDSKLRTATFTGQTIALRSEGGGRISPSLITVTQANVNGYRDDAIVKHDQPGGKITIYARSLYGEISQTADVGESLPWSLLAGALIGSALGAVAKSLKLRPNKRVPWGRVILRACIVGVIVGAATWAGLANDIIPSVLARTVIGIFALAALVGYTGTIAIDLITKKFFPA